MGILDLPEARRRNGDEGADLRGSAQRAHGRLYWAVVLLLFLVGFLLRVAFRDSKSTAGGAAFDLGTFVALIVALHFLYETIVRRAEREMLAYEVRTAVSSNNEVLLHHIHELTKLALRDRIRVSSNREQIYADMLRTMEQIDTDDTRQNTILIAPLHWHDTRRRTEVAESEMNVAFKAFRDKMRVCMRSPHWSVKEIYNIVDKERLEMVEERLRFAQMSEEYEVRAFCLPGAFPMIAPLIVNDTDVFLGLDDKTYYGISAGVHASGKDVVELVKAYFESLWNDPRAYKLRTHEIDETTLAKLRADVLETSGGGHSRSDRSVTPR